MTHHHWGLEVGLYEESWASRQSKSQMEIKEAIKLVRHFNIPRSEERQEPLEILRGHFSFLHIRLYILMVTAVQHTKMNETPKIRGNTRSHSHHFIA